MHKQFILYLLMHQDPAPGIRTNQTKQLVSQVELDYRFTNKEIVYVTENKVFK